MNKLTVSASPHMHTHDSVRSIMLDVFIALMPAAICGPYFFGIRSALVLLVTVLSCVLGEALFEILAKRKITVSDCSAAVTGLLLGLNLPSGIPLWMAALGGLFSIIIVKQIFGGLGKNFMNPALAGRCFMLIAWTGAMTTFASPLAADAISSATPLAVMKSGSSELPSLWNAFIGRIPGCIGETSAVALILGFIYLLIRRVVSIRIPAAYIITFALLTYLFGTGAEGMSQAQYTAYQLCTGGLLLGAFFMATDYVTTPTTPMGMVIFGIGCGVLTFIIRNFGGYPEGVSFSIILMNIASPLIESATAPKCFGKAGKKI